MPRVDLSVTSPPFLRDLDERGQLRFRTASISDRSFCDQVAEKRSKLPKRHAAPGVSFFGCGAPVALDRFMHQCGCAIGNHDPKLVVLTGGPGAGKTAVLEVVRRHFCPHVVVLPESASILFSGGFPRRKTEIGMRSAQRAIFWVQRELERMALEEHRAAVVLCDRGTIDGLAYWPDAPAAFFRDVKTSLDEELARYAAVIHLRTPEEHRGYDRSNPIRTETADEARAIDARIASVWRPHPRRFLVENEVEFVDKLARAIAVIEGELPACCRSQDAPMVGPIR